MVSHKAKSFLVIRILLWIVILILVLFSVMGLIYSHEEIDLGKEMRYAPLALTGDWKVMQGDQFDFIQPSYDDSHWQIMQTSSPGGMQVMTTPRGAVWYRKWIYIPSDKPAFALALQLGKIAFLDKVFLNGHLLAANGPVATKNLFVERVGIYQIPQGVIQFGEYNLISVRATGGIDGVVGFCDGKCIIGDYSELWTELIRNEVVVLIFSGSFIILGLCMLVFFLKKAGGWEYLFFALGSIDMGIYTFYVSQWRYILGVERLWDPQIYYTCVFFVVPLFLRFIYELLPRNTSQTRVEKLFDYMTKSLLCYATLVVLYLIMNQDIKTWEFVDFYINDFLIAVSSFIGIFYLVYKLSIENRDGIIMFLGSILSFVGGILEIARQYHPGIPQYMATWGLAVFIFSQASVLANRFLRLHHEVEEYSYSLEKMVDVRTKQLKKIEESRRRILANVSHDVRTPIASVIGHVEFLLEDIAESPAQQRTYLKRIHSKMLGLHRLIQDLFELTKIETQQVEFHKVEVVVWEFIEKMYDKYFFDVQNAGFRFICKNQIQNSVKIVADLDRLDQVFANLISNATRYAKAGGIIRIQWEITDQVPDAAEKTEHPPMLLIKVSDDGSGIGVDHIANIFERFYRGSEARETSSENSGLGLAIAKEIVVAHGGQIWIDTTVERGCTVCFVLPCTLV